MQGLCCRSNAPFKGDFRIVWISMFTLFKSRYWIEIIFEIALGRRWPIDYMQRLHTRHSWEQSFNTKSSGLNQISLHCIFLAHLFTLSHGSTHNIRSVTVSQMHMLSHGSTNKYAQSRLSAHIRLVTVPRQNTLSHGSTPKYAQSRVHAKIHAGTVPRTNPLSHGSMQNIRPDTVPRTTPLLMSVNLTMFHVYFIKHCVCTSSFMIVQWPTNDCMVDYVTRISKDQRRQQTCRVRVFSLIRFNLIHQSTNVKLQV